MIGWIALSDNRVPIGTVGWVHFGNNVVTISVSCLRIIWVMFPSLEVRSHFGIVVGRKFVGYFHVAQLHSCVYHINLVGQLNGEQFRFLAAQREIGDYFTKRRDRLGFPSALIRGSNFQKD
jgi:hypothetical protein